MPTASTAKKTVEALKCANKTLACAESCTGGLIAKKITDVSGASAVFHGGVVSYVNAVKNVVLGVDRTDLETHGAVSEAVARQMAAGARLLLHTDLAVSTTGVAGPAKDERGNAVGTVYIALATESGTVCHRCHFDGTRTQIRMAAADYALSLVLRHLNEEVLQDIPNTEIQEVL